MSIVGGELGCEEGWLEIEGAKLGLDDGLQSLAQNGPKSASTGSLVNAQADPLKMRVERS